MKRRISWTQRIADSVQLSGESLPMQPLLELCGDRRVLIENHNGVTAYGPERIQVRVRYGEIAVTGTNLRLCRMQGQLLVIMGRVDGICVIRGKQ